MIGKLSGVIAGKTPGGALLIDISGVGYLVRVKPETARRLAAQKEAASVFTHLSVREDALDLYGFETQEELRFFELLLSVSGIGPKSALGILSLGEVATLESAIAAGDTSYLTKVSGIGKKSAARIVVELRDKLGASGGERIAHDLRGDTDAFEALHTLGYSTEDAREALKRVDKAVLGTQNRLREALKLLGK